MVDPVAMDDNDNTIMPMADPIAMEGKDKIAQILMLKNQTISTHPWHTSELSSRANYKKKKKSFYYFLRFIM